MSKPYWVSGPPGTGKTRIYIKNLYKEYLDKGVMWNRIVILSHTVNAAREILKAIKELPQLENIPEDVLEEQIMEKGLGINILYMRLYHKNTVNSALQEKCG